MSLWGIILLVVLIMSATMIILGLVFAIAGPKKINYIMGYRTPRSMKNLETWQFGNRTAGTYMWRTGVILLIGSLIALFAVINASEQVIQTAGMIIIIIHGVMVFGAVILTEIKLRKYFDRNGNRKF